MSLPLSARQLLVQPLRAARTLDREVRTFNTLPIGEWAWKQHSDALVSSIEKFVEVLDSPAEDFNAIRDWIRQLLDCRLAVGSHLFALEPFAPFDSTRGNTILRLLDEALGAVADSVEAAKDPLACSGGELLDAAAWWKARDAGCAGASVIAAAFAMTEAPVDENGEFRADWVLQHYAYRSNELLQNLLPHLASLGVPGVVDVLAAVSVVGWIVDCDDPVTAYAAMDSFVNRYITADEHVAGLVRSHLEDSEPALRRARQAANRAVAGAASVPSDSESRALALADVNKRVVEGPFRQFSWELYCLQRGEWESPPMLTSLRERLVSGGGLLASVARDAVLPDLRNSETHETLAWDGFREEFVTEGGRLQPSRVALALVLATSFAQGCEAGLSAVRSLGLQLGDALPSSDEIGRMPSWRRVQAFFGTNRLRLVAARLNTRHAHLRVARLAFTDINPCFQALILARRLLPNVETFSVSTGSGDEAVIVVGADALDASMPMWEYAFQP